MIFFVLSLQDAEVLAKRLEKKKVLLNSEKLISKHLEAQIREMESRLLCGGKNIIDHTNEQQKALELHTQEIAERKVKLKLKGMFPTGFRTCNTTFQWPTLTSKMRAICM